MHNFSFLKLYQSDKNLKKLSLSLVFISIILQILVIIYYWGTTQFSDAAGYLTISERCIEQDSWYPNNENIYDNFIWSLGFINWLIIQIKLFGSSIYNPIFNLLFELGILFNIFYIGKKFFSEKVAYITIAIYSLIYSNIIIVIPRLTELPYLFFALTAFSLCLRPNYLKLFFAGILFVVANTFRPLAIIFLITTIIYLAFFYRLKIKYYLTLIVGIMLCLLFVGGISMKNTGHFIYQSTTGGLNMLMGAHDKATGGVMMSIFKKENEVGWIENAEELTYKEKDKIWKERSIEWIINHPIKYSLLYLNKIVAIYAFDSWPDGSFIKQPTLGEVLKDNGITSEIFLEIIVPRTLKSIFYYIILLLGVYSLFKMKKDDWKSPKLVLLLLIIMGTCVTAIFPGGSRFHHPFLFIIVLWTAWLIEQYMTKKTRNKNLN